MLWDLIATIVAGLGAAGIAMLLRKLSANKLPRSLVPIFAGIAMILFQVIGEYQWFEHQQTLLPEGVAVVMTAQDQKPWRPWSYLWPQTNRFIAADFKNAVANEHNPNIKLLTLYVFEQKSPALPIKQVIDCQFKKRADFSKELPIPAQGEAPNELWRDVETDSKLLEVCHP